MRAQRILLGTIELELKRASLPPLSWYDVLWELERAPEARLRPFEIERRTLLAQHNLSRLLDRMAAADLIRREAFADDGRGQWVTITGAGRAMRAAIWAVYGPALAQLIDGKLADQEATTLADLLARLTRTSREDQRITGR